MDYLPHTDEDREQMFEAIGIQSFDELFEDIPRKVRYPNFELPPPCSEIEILREMQNLANKNKIVDPSDCFLGAGTYRHYRPSTVDSILRRGELYTSYTPYQPEMSQGMLQALFEYQSMICRLTGMEVCNASHYDGATSLAEAVLLSINVAEGEKNRVILSPNINPQYKEVVRTYLSGTKSAVVEVDRNSCDTDQLKLLLDDKTCALIIQNPNYVGQLEDMAGLSDCVHSLGAILICISDPIALGIFRPPGEYGADIVVADGQCLGIPTSFGGPHLGIFATKKKFVRKLAGRIVGQTVDSVGTRGYVMTLATREQHIRRAKATSNICTNAALSALGAAVYLSTLGKSGLKRIAELCYHKCHYAAQRISELTDLEINPQSPSSTFFKEFVVHLSRPVAEVNEVLLKEFGIIGGHDLGQDNPEYRNFMLVAVTEQNTRQSIDRLAQGLRNAQ